MQVSTHPIAAIAETSADTSMTVGERIRKVRTERGWTQDQLARHVDVSRSAVAQWETDRVGQVRGNLTRIAEVLDVSVEFLLHGQDKRAPLAAGSGDELALLRLYRQCEAEDRTFLLRTARKLAKAAGAKEPAG
jgi:transcriptional regulator with XRE-family HTH domain